MDRLIHNIRILLLACFHIHRSRPGTLSFVRRFSYSDIKRATDGFRRIIDISSHGVAYKAKFRDGRVALVKEVRDFDVEKGAFYKEVQLLGHLRHRHIVSLNGFSTGRKRFLVFENIENGSLKDHLNDPLKTPLNWKTRLQIVIGVAAALEYLHFFCDPPMFHISVSSSTILLDENFNAKLCDIGILGSHGNHITLLESLGSTEYSGPVCGNIFFQLGLLILELVTGQCSEEGGVDIIQWVQESHYSQSIHKMLDPDLGNNFDSRELKGLLAVARLCIKSVDKPPLFTSQVFSISASDGRDVPVVVTKTAPVRLDGKGRLIRNNPGFPSSNVIKSKIPRICCPIQQ